MADSPVLFTSSDYAAFAQELYETGIISDPWLEGQERFRLEPVILPAALYGSMCAAGEAIGRAYDELAQIVWENPSLLEDYFHLTPYQKLMWLASGGRWHGIARLDMFVLQDGSIRTCEMNSDTPSGEAETVVLNRMRHALHPGTTDPNEKFEERFVTMMLQTYAASAGAQAKDHPSIGILYPTDLPEDLSMIALYRQWFQQRGWEVTLGSPYNLHRTASGGAALFDTPVDILIRHYKTDWWGERIPAWSDEDDYDDPDPLDLPLRIALDADAAGTLTVINPFGAVMTQNKLTMAFMWNQIGQFTPESQRAIRAFIPETHRLLDFTAEGTLKDDWVLKSDYGCEGDEVILGRSVSEEIWQQSLEMAIPERWIVQRFFEAMPSPGDTIPNYGLYLIAGKAAGIFTRLSPLSTDYHSLVPPTFVGVSE